MNTEKRMHRFNKIEIVDAPNNIEKWFTTQKYSDDKITVFQLRNMIFIDQDDQKKVYSDLINHLSIDQRNKSKILSISIKTENNINRLIELLESNEHKELELQIIKRILVIDKNIYRNYLNLLTIKYTEKQFDCIIQVLVETIRLKNIGEEIINILKGNYVRDPQDFASLIQIIGLCDSGFINYLYSFYNYFKDNFPSENYFEGPLFGISYYIKKRRRTTAST